MWIPTLILLLGPGQNPTDARDAAAINAAKQVVVRTIDAALPPISFEEWLRGVVGTGASTKWEVNDCGEQSGDGKQQGRDFPMCAEAQVDLGSQRTLHVSLGVGSVRQGVRGAPTFRMAYITTAGNSGDWIRSLAEIPSAIRIGAKQ